MIIQVDFRKENRNSRNTFPQPSKRIIFGKGKLESEIEDIWTSLRKNYV